LHLKLLRSGAIKKLASSNSKLAAVNNYRVWLLVSLLYWIHLRIDEKNRCQKSTDVPIPKIKKLMMMEMWKLLLYIETHSLTYSPTWFFLFIKSL
jgi:hypothetical protein